MNLSEAQRKYLIHEQIIGAAIVNGLLNGLLGWLAFRKHPAVPMLGESSIVNDTIGTAVLLPLFVCLIATPLIRKAVKAGKVAPLTAASEARSMVLWLPANPFLRGLVLALGALASCATVLLGLLALLGVQQMSVSGFVIVKMLYSAILAALVSPIIALYVLASEAPTAAVATLDLND
jgi:hypothetical protein